MVTNTNTQLRTLIADDGYAMSFQSMGQYRTALLKALDATQQAAPDLRTEFEARIRQCNKKPSLLDRWPAGEYTDNVVEAMWKGFELAQPASRQAAPEASEVKALRAQNANLVASMQRIMDVFRNSSEPPSLVTGEMYRIASASTCPVAAPEAPTAWIQYVDGVKTQNVARDETEKAEIERIAAIMVPTAKIAWTALYASPGAAPEAPATERQAEGKPYFRDLEFDPPSGLFTTAISLDPTPAATTASAAWNPETRCPACDVLCPTPGPCDAKGCSMATTASASGERYHGGACPDCGADTSYASHWGDCKLFPSGRATAPSRNADWQSGYETGYETGLGDGRAEFTNPAATSPAERAAVAATEKKEQKS